MFPAGNKANCLLSVNHYAKTIHSSSILPFFNIYAYSTTGWKMSKYWVISGPYFPVFGLNTGKYGPEITRCLHTFYVVITSCYVSEKFQKGKKYNCPLSCEIDSYSPGTMSRALFPSREYSKYMSSVLQNHSHVKKIVEDVADDVRFSR